MNQREALIQNIDQIDEIREGFLANGYANMIKQREGQVRAPSMSDVIAGIIAENHLNWETEYEERQKR